MFESIDPATGERFATHPVLGDEALETRLAAAAEGFRAWRATGIDERTALLARLADAYDDHVEDLATMAVREMGKTIAEARGEVRKCATAFRYYATNGAELLRGRSISLASGDEAETRYLPLGPVLAVMPWNFPYWQVVRFLAPTILAGNVGLLKHASNVQGVAASLERMMAAAGAPAGLFQNLAVRSHSVAGIIEDPRVAAVTLTGSEGAGRAVAATAGRALKKVVLELGGSDPFVVMPSADLDAAVAGAVRARVQNAGQSCVCGKRMIVHTDIYDAFRDRFIAAMAAVEVGDPMDPATRMGPLSSAAQRDTVLEQVGAALAEGATLLVGAEKRPGSGAFLTPGVLEDVPPGGPAAHDEIFGPVAMLFRVNDIDQAIELANAIPFGLGSSVWTHVAEEGERFVQGIEAGMTAINQVLASEPEAPFGGIKASGHGRELGPYGMHEFMNLKTVFRPAI